MDKPETRDRRREKGGNLMKGRGESPLGHLEKVFHEPKRLALMAALAGSEHQRRGLGRKTFTALKEEVDLTDGNLNRHLKVLEEAGAVRMDKQGRGRASRTEVEITAAGKKDFSAYLDQLEEILQRAHASLQSEKQRARESDLRRGLASPETI